VIPVEKAWQRIAEGLLNLEKDWEDFQGVLVGAGNLEKLDPHTQHLLSLSTCRSTFLTALERLAVYARRNGGLEFLLIEELEKPTDEDEED